MANTVLSLFAALLIFLVLTEILTIKLYLGENYIIELHFIVFAVVLKKSESRKKVRSAKKSKRRQSFNFWYSLILLLMQNSRVKINSLHVSIPKNEPMQDAILYGIYSGITSSFLAFVENNSKFFEASNITFSHSEHNKVKKVLEAELEIFIIDAIISAVKVSLSVLFSRLSEKRMKKRNG